MAEDDHGRGTGDAPELGFLRGRVAELKQENHALRCSVAKQNMRTAPEPEMPLEPERPTLRDRFAMSALQGLLAGREWIDCPERAYKYSEAMLKARELPPEDL